MQLPERVLAWSVRSAFRERPERGMSLEVKLSAASTSCCSCSASWTAAAARPSSGVGPLLLIARRKTSPTTVAHQNIKRGANDNAAGRGKIRALAASYGRKPGSTVRNVPGTRSEARRSERSVTLGNLAWRSVQVGWLILF